MSEFDIEKLSRRLNMNEQRIMGEDEAFKSAVLVPLVNVSGQWHILFEIRSYQMKRQPGDICFPGGRLEPADDTPEQTALRETCEELNLQHTDIDILGPMDIFVPSSRFIVYPYVGVIRHPESIKPAPEEVHDTFCVPLDWLIKHEPQRHDVHFEVKPPGDFPYQYIAGGENYDWQSRKMPELFFIYKNRAIWGMTAYMLNHFLQLFRDEPASS